MLLIDVIKEYLWYFLIAVSKLKVIIEFVLVIVVEVFGLKCLKLLEIEKKNKIRLVVIDVCICLVFELFSENIFG